MIRSSLRRLTTLAVAVLGFGAAAGAPLTAADALKIAYSDWPGWVAFEVAIQKGWYKDAGVNVDFVWMEYAPSMEAIQAGKVDAVTVTNGDQLVMGAAGKSSNAYRPALSLAFDPTKFPAESNSLICAFATAAPDGSVIVPASDPRPPSIALS